MTDLKEFGLKEDWLAVEQILKQVIPVYDKTNRYISLGRDIKIRKEGLSLLRKTLGEDIGELSIIDLGAGTGKLTQLFERPSVMVDALPSMLQIASERNSTSEGVSAVFENLPFKIGTFSAAMAAFSIRDAKHLKKAFFQINEILEPGGSFLIVDLTKPDSTLKRRMIAFYWRTIAPLIAFIVAGRLGLKFAALSTTYRRLPKNSDFLMIAQDAGFEIVKSRSYMLGGAGIFLLRKPV